LHLAPLNRGLRAMLHTRRSAEAWSVVSVEFRKALALRSEIRRAGSFNQLCSALLAGLFGLPSAIMEDQEG
jgi:hypothetical protein